MRHRFRASRGRWGSAKHSRTHFQQPTTRWPIGESASLTVARSVVGKIGTSGTGEGDGFRPGRELWPVGWKSMTSQPVVPIPCSTKPNSCGAGTARPGIGNARANKVPSRWDLKRRSVSGVVAASGRPSPEPDRTPTSLGGNEAGVDDFIRKLGGSLSLPPRHARGRPGTRFYRHLIARNTTAKPPPTRPSACSKAARVSSSRLKILEIKVPRLCQPVSPRMVFLARPGEPWHQLSTGGQTLRLRNVGTEHAPLTSTFAIGPLLGRRTSSPSPSNGVANHCWAQLMGAKHWHPCLLCCEFAVSVTLTSVGS